MTGILDRIRNTTVADLENVSGDFSELVSTYRPRVAREMIREVEGATDLRPAVTVPNMNAGMVRLDGTGPVDTRPFQDEIGLPTDKQRAFISSLLDQLRDLDEAQGARAYTWTREMSEKRAWDRSRGGNVSRWIDSLKAKIAELKAAPKVTAPEGDNFEDVPDGYYAVGDADDIKFYRVSTGRKGGAYEGRRFVKVQASDELHSIRNPSHREAILTAIREMGWEQSMALYGQHIGRCGRCRRTLTDAESRAAGIGPECRKKM